LSMAPLRLRCIRWDEMDPMGSPVGVGVLACGWCASCRRTFEDMRERGVSWWRRYALMRRSQRGMERHPTYKALSAALDALESTPHGTLVEAG
jgi:hypothetical protein